MSSKDASLYGIRPSRKPTKEISSSTSLEFTTTLSSLLSTSTKSIPTHGRPRPSKTKTDIFTSHNKGSKKRAARDLENDDVRETIGRQDIGGVDDAALHRSKRKLEEKARVYKQMKRGEYIAGENEPEGLIDFDTKWAEGEGGIGEVSSDDVESNDGSREIVEYEDEFGRMRRGTRVEVDRMERRKMNRLLGAEELDRMSARPTMPSKIIFGDTVQTAAFDPEEPILEKMKEIAKKRDRSMTPPEAKHYEADKEFRIKGVGFYTFSKDEKVREEEMRALERGRGETERVRRERDERKERRKREIEERKEVLAEKRARKQADAFLEGLGVDRKIDGVKEGMK